MLKILQVRPQEYLNQEFPEVQPGFRKSRGTRDQTANIHWIIVKARKFQENIYFCFIDYSKAFVWITTNCGKFLKRWQYQTILPISWEMCMQVKKQQSEPYIEQLTGSKSGKKYDKVVYCHPAYLIISRVHHVKYQAGWDTSRNQGCRGNINNLRYAGDTTPLAESEEELKSLLMKVKEESEKAGLKLNIQKTKIMASGLKTSWQINGEKGEAVTDFSLLGFQNHCRWWLQPWILKMLVSWKEGYDKPRQCVKKSKTSLCQQRSI